MNRIFRGVGLLGCFFCLQSFASVHIDDEQSYVLTQSTWTGEVRQLKIATASPLLTEFQIVAVTLKNAQAAFYLQPSKAQALSLQQVVKAQQALIGINGGYFTKDFEPDGLLMIKGKTLAPYVDNSLFSAWIGIDAHHQLVILPNTGANSFGSLQTVMEVGPLLINQGIMLVGRVNALNPFAMRTVLALSSGGKLIVISTSAISLYTLENILYQHPEWFGVSKIMIAANLDGGKSTALFVNDPKQKIDVPAAQALKVILLFHRA